MRMKLALACGSLLIGLACADTAHGQLAVPRYTPPTPTTSRYLQLLRNDGGVLPSYYSLVRPQDRQTELLNRQVLLNRQQARTIEQQADELQSLNRNLASGVIAPTGSRSWYMSRGTRNMFRDTSHFYGQRQPPQPFRR